LRFAALLRAESVLCGFQAADIQGIDGDVRFVAGIDGGG